METSEVIKPELETNAKPLIKGRVLSADELKRLTDFFSLLIQIDQRTRKGVLKNASSKSSK